MAADPLGLIGTSIADKYLVEGVVGEGGFAIVYRAMHTLWKRPVAVKVFKALGEVAADERKKLLDDFIQEGVLLADLSERSTAICQARDIGMLTTPKGDQVPYMVLEWLDGKPLEDVLAAERKDGSPQRSIEDTVRLLDPVAEALALAHKKGIAHRDVKPANVFVLGDPRGADTSVKLLDFGIAKVVQDAQKMGFGKTAGHITSFTPSYGAPEQFNRAYGATGPWTDVYAFALVVVEVLSGREPIPGDTIVQLAYATSDTNRRPTPRTFGLAVSDEIEQIFLKALAVKPDDRYQSAGEFWNALRPTVMGRRMSSLESMRSIPSNALDQTQLAPPNQGAPIGPSPNAATAAAPPQEIMMSAAPVAPAAKSRGPMIAIVAVLLGSSLGGGAFFVARKGARDVPSAPSMTAAPPVVASVAPAATCPEGMAKIPGGEFFMGSDEKDSEANEKPPHRVKLAPYCLDIYEVSVEKYKACSDKGMCLRAGKVNAWPGITPAQQKIYDPLCTANDATKFGRHPINCVDWEQASKFCENTGGRLPTEAEWEFAARGSDGRIYPWGDSPPNHELLNACGKECVDWMKKNPDPDQPIAAMYDEDDGFPATAPIGSFPKGKSSYGIHDIAGNVWEWVADYYADYDPASKDSVSLAPKGAEKGKERVIRGGAWNGASPAWVRPSWRFRSDPSFRTHGIGFRCAKSL